MLSSPPTWWTALDYGSHTLFIAEVTEAAALSSESSVDV